MGHAKVHSAQDFGPYRDFWWNEDFLWLMKARWRLPVEDGRCLDVGCGQGHWTRLLHRLYPDMSFVCLDREERSLDILRQQSQRWGYPIQLETIVGSADVLPFPDASFDVVSCQTLLIHVKDPARVLAECFRVLKPGGRIIAAEPNNAASWLMADSLSDPDRVEETLDYVRFNLFCEKGRRLLGEGHISMGDQLGGLLYRAGFTDINCYISDKVSSILPPYDKAEDLANIRQIHELESEERVIWDRRDSLRYFLAGGGTEVEFDQLWGRVLGQLSWKAKKMALQGNQYFSSSATVMYLNSAMKPED